MTANLSGSTDNAAPTPTCHAPSLPVVSISTILRSASASASPAFTSRSSPAPAYTGYRSRSTTGSPLADRAGICDSRKSAPSNALTSSHQAPCGDARRSRPKSGGSPAPALNVRHRQAWHRRRRARGHSSLPPGRRGRARDARRAARCRGRWSRPYGSHIRGAAHRCARRSRSPDAPTSRHVEQPEAGHLAGRAVHAVRIADAPAEHLVPAAQAEHPAGGARVGDGVVVPAVLTKETQSTEGRLRARQHDDADVARQGRARRMNANSTPGSILNGSASSKLAMRESIGATILMRPPPGRDGAGAGRSSATASSGGRRRTASSHGDDAPARPAGTPLDHLRGFDGAALVVADGLLQHLGGGAGLDDVLPPAGRKLAFQQQPDARASELDDPPSCEYRRTDRGVPRGLNLARRNPDQ